MWPTLFKNHLHPQSQLGRRKPELLLPLLVSYEIVGFSIVNVTFPDASTSKTVSENSPVAGGSRRVQDEPNPFQETPGKSSLVSFILPL
jgi:hypothetical protein